MWQSRAILAALLATATAVPALAAEGEAAAPQTIKAREGQMIYTSTGRALLPIYKMTAAGEPRVIVGGRLITVPAATLTMSGQKLTTSLSIDDLRRMARR
jgi:hypothetical protein